MELGFLEIGAQIEMPFVSCNSIIFDIDERGFSLYSRRTIRAI